MSEPRWIETKQQPLKGSYVALVEKPVDPYCRIYEPVQGDCTLEETEGRVTADLPLGADERGARINACSNCGKREDQCGCGELRDCW